MPIVGVNRDQFFEKLGENFGAKPNITDEEVDSKFNDLCFDYGIELDDVTSEKEMTRKEKGKVDANASDAVIYKVDVPANRYDILCVEGLARSLRIFKGKEKPPEYKVTKPKQMQKMIVKKETDTVRPYVVCAILRNIKFTQERYDSFIDLQEKLHQNICRRRTLVSIGTHDLDTIEGPFTYEALPPKEINFVPLRDTKSFNGEELMNHLESDLQLKKYLHIIRDSPLYPVIYDKNRTVCSLPPIINGAHSKITLNTKNVFIEVTATDLTKAEVVLNTVCAMFSEYCQDKFSVEPVEVFYEKDNNTFVYPNLSSRSVKVSPESIAKGIGADIAADKIVELLNRMSLTSQLSQDGKTIDVSVPCTRSDILHPCDILEDVAIAFGYNNIQRSIPQTLTNGYEQPINKLSDQLRSEVAMTGFTEVFTFALCSREENFKLLNKEDDKSAITIENPQTMEFQVARTSLFPGILKTLTHNRDAPLPVKLFEISDVVLKSNVTDVGAKNNRRLAALYCDHSSGFEIIHGLLDRVMLLLRVPWKGEEKRPGDKCYYLKPSEDPTFFPGRRADIFLNDKKIGVMGVLHPQVLENFHITFPCSALELEIEHFV